MLVSVLSLWGLFIPPEERIRNMAQVDNKAFSDRLEILIATIRVCGIAGRMPQKTFPAIGENVIQTAGEIERRRPG